MSSYIFKDYLFFNSRIISLHLDIKYNSADLLLSAERITEIDYRGMISKKVPCTLKITFHNLIKVKVFNVLPSIGAFIDHGVYLGGAFEDTPVAVGMHFKLHDSANEVPEKDNWIIRSKGWSCIEV